MAPGAMPVLNFRHGPMTELELNTGSRMDPTKFTVHDIAPATGVGNSGVDLVARCGNNMGGSFVYSLVATDVCTG